MSNKNKARLSLKGDLNAPTTAPIEQVQAAPSAPIQEKTMEAVQEKTQAEVTELSEPTAKQMAEMEALNAERARKQVELHNAAAERADPVPIADIAARGYDALHEAFRRHNEQNKPKEYVPPPRTERQMTALQEELEAGRRTQARAQAQQDARPPTPPNPNEGFTTPAYRPGNLVPDPTVAAVGGSAAGNRVYGPDAP